MGSRDELQCYVPRRWTEAGLHTFGIVDMQDSGDIAQYALAVIVFESKGRAVQGAFDVTVEEFDKRGFGANMRPVSTV